MNLRYSSQTARRHFGFLFIAIMLLQTPAFGQQSGYDEELGQLSGELRSLLVRVERLDPHLTAMRIELQEQLFDLSKRLHRLEEEASAANLQLMRQGSPPDKKLILASAIAKALDLSQSLAGSYIDTRMPVFWSQALAAAQTARTLQTAQR